MNPKAMPQQNVGLEDETRIETHCYLCQQDLPDGPAIVSSKCGVNYHDDCARRAVKCPACGENLLEHFLNEEARRKIVKKDRLYTMLLFIIPFIIIEVFIGFWSMINHPSRWSILPWIGEAFLLDLLILIIGILIAIVIVYKFGYKPEKKAINTLVLEQKGATPGKPEEQLYTCGYGDRAKPFTFGDVSIPKKVAVQKEGIVRVVVDRLTMTPQGTYVWVNPRFLKLLKPNKNPQPSNPEELEQVWKASGRSKIMGEGAEEGAEGGAEEGEEKLCSTCAKPLEYIAEYDAWYCASCGKYEEKEGEESEEPPPPPA